MIDSSPGEEPRWLATADELAHQLITRAEPIRFTVADGDEELEAIFTLRHRTVVEEGWARHDEFSDGLERDAYDDHASHVAAWDGETLAGTLRVVFPRPDFPLPVERSHGLVVEPRGEVVGAGRVIVARPYRHQGHTVLGGLSATAWLLMRQRGFRWAAGTATKEILDLFRRLGFEVTILGDAQTHWGEERYPIRMGAPDPSRWV
jgi:predicted GNAT family N-acyltransferase